MSKIDKVKNVVDKATAGYSKKIILTLLFLISVLSDKLWLEDVVYGEDLFSSKVFWAIAISIVIILTKDIQTLINKIIKGKFGIED